MKTGAAARGAGRGVGVGLYAVLLMAAVATTLVHEVG
jgi:hypothetical protein